MSLEDTLIELPEPVKILGHNLSSMIMICLLGILCHLFATDFTIAVNRPGLIILEAQLDSVWVDNTNGKQRIRASAPAKLLSRPGLPEIPYFHALLEGVPHTADIQLFFSTAENLSLSNPALVPAELAKGIRAELPLGGSVGSYPSTDYRWTSAGEVHGIPVQSLEVYPVVVKNLSQVLIRKQATVRIQWNPAVAPMGQARFFWGTGQNRMPAALGRSSVTPNEIPDYHFSENLTRIVVDSTGWYRLTRSALEDSGLTLSNVDPRTFRLWHRGEEQLLWVEGEQDGHFSLDDEIIFFAERNSARTEDYIDDYYTDDNCYWLTWGDENGDRYAEESGYPNLPQDQVLRFSGYPTKIHIERSENFNRLGKMGLHELWDTFDHFFMSPPINVGTNVDFAIEIPHPRQTDQSKFSVTVRLQGVTEGEHTISVYVNDVKTAEGSWSGQSASTVSSSGELEWPNSYLQHGENTLTVSQEGGYSEGGHDQVLLDWVEIEYERLYRAYNDYIEFTGVGEVDFYYQFEIAGFSSSNIYVFKNGVSRIRDFVTVYDQESDSYMVIFQDWVESATTKYTAFSDIALMNPKSLRPEAPISRVLSGGGGDYLVISPRDFLAILEPLVGHYGADTVAVEEVYRQYNDGVISPYAIKSFLEDVYHNWSPVPEYVLLAGAAYLWKNDKTSLPVMFYQSYKWGATATDYWYALVDDGDYIPEFHVGRFPARDGEELQAMVDKTMAYLENEGSGVWQNEILMIAGYETTFKDQSEAMIGSLVGTGFFTNRLYIDPFSEGGPYFGTTDSLVKIINDGLVMVNFLGHGGGAIWGDRSLLTLDDLPLLENGFRTPFITSMTCFTGDMSSAGALGEQMLTLEGGGAVAFFGSTGIGWLINDYLLLQPILSSLLSEQVSTLGRILDLAKVIYVSTNNRYPDIAKSLVFQYNLLGDPALRLRFPDEEDIAVSPDDPEPGEEITISVSNPASDSLYVMLFDPQNEPVLLSPALVLSSESGFRWNLPVNLPSGNYVLNVSRTGNDGSVYHKSLPMGVSAATVYITELEPSSPTHRDSIWVEAYVSDRRGVDSVRAFLSGDTLVSRIMVETGDRIFRTESPFPPQSPGRAVSLWLEVVDESGERSRSSTYEIAIPELPDFTVRALGFQVDDDIQMSAEIENLSVGPGRAVAMLERLGSPGIWEYMDTDSVQFEGLGTQQVIFDGPFLQGEWAYRVTANPDSSVDETDYSDNVLVDTLETSSFWVTPELGSTEDLVTHSSVGISSVTVDIAAGSVVNPIPITLGRIESVNLQNQPDFSVISFGEGSEGIRLEFAHAIDSFAVAWHWSEGIPDSGKLYQWYPQYQTWLPITVDSLSRDSTGIFFETDASTQFSWVFARDVDSPRLEATLNGLRFMQDSYISTEPQISVVVQDENGIDFRLSAMQLFKNKEEYDAHIEIPASSPPNFLPLRFSPHLSPEDTSLGILVQDASGNRSDTLTLRFMVKEKLELIDYGNFPNPFTDRTMFAYELTHAVDQFSLDIYSVAGESVIHFDNEAVLSDLDLGAPAYHEIVWNGRDEQGEFVDNGVYFYRMRARMGKKVIQKYGKVAKGR